MRYRTCVSGLVTVLTVVTSVSSGAGTAAAVGTQPPPTPAAIAAAIQSGAITKAKAAPPKAKITINIRKGIKFRKRHVLFSNRAYEIKGTIAPFAVGDQVTVNLIRRGKTVRSYRPKIISALTGSARYTLRVKLPGHKPAWLVVRHQHASGLPPATVRQQLHIVNPRDTKPNGFTFALFQDRLSALGYWPTLSGVNDLKTRDAILTYRMVNRLGASSSLTQHVYNQVLAGRGAFRPRYRANGSRRVEADLNRRVVALINPNNKIYRVTYASPGKPSTPTVVGHFRAYSKAPGTNGSGMVNSVYFHAAYAMHGYHSVPAYAASHGCLRLPTILSADIMRWVPIGARVDTYW